MATIVDCAKRVFVSSSRLFLEHTNIIVISATAAAILYTRSAGIAYFAGGAVSCSLSVKLVKKFIKQPRPLHPLPGRQKKSYGMPSTHSAVITYYAAFTLLACTYLPLHPSLPQTALVRIIAPLIILPWSASIAISRIWLGHHTLAQVAAGCAHGLLFTYLWFKLWVLYASDYAQDVERAHMRLLQWR